MSAAFECYRCGLIGCTGEDCPQPTASVDAEPVAWLYEHPEAKPLLRHSRFPMSVPGWTETPLYTEAQMQARADAARREALEEAAKVARDYASKAAQRGWVLKPGSIVTAARHIATTIRALKGGQQ